MPSSLLSDSQEAEFRRGFSQIYPRFIPQLHRDYPAVTSNDELIAMLIYMKYSTEEIALSLGIGRRGVNSARYRLRKKLNLDKETDLDTFLRSPQRLTLVLHHTGLNILMLPPSLNNITLRYLKYRHAENILDRCDCLNREVVRAPHPFAYFRLILTQHIGKILLFKTFCFQDAVNPVHYQKRQIYAASHLGRNFCPASFYDATSFHRE